MKKFSDEFRPALREMRQLNALVGYYDNKGFYILTTEEDDNLLTQNEFEIATESGIIEYDKESINSVNPLFNTSLFKTTCKSVQIECKNKINVGTYIKVKIGVYKPDKDKYEYLNYGDYYINEEPVYQADSDSYLITGYDKMIESMIDFDSQPILIEKPIKHKDLVIAICNKLGWKYNLIDYPNADKIIQKDFYSGQGLTYRNILDDLNGVCGGSFMFNLENKLIWKRPTETEQIVEDDDLKDVNVDFAEKYGKVNALTITTNGNVVLDNREDSESIAENGKTEININDNYILNYSTDDFIDNMFDEINGLEYYLYDIDSTGLLIFEPLDILTFRHNGIDYKTIMFNDDIKLTQGLVETTFAEKPEEEKKDYNTTNKEQNKLNNALISLDKANAEIVLKVNSAGNIAQVRLDGDSDDGALVNIKADNIKLEGYTTINDGFSVDEQGNATMNNGTMKNAEITGGNIELIDDGSSSTHSLMIYNEDSVEITTKNITESYNNDLSNNVLKFSFPDNDLSLGFGILEQTILKTDNNYSIYSIAQDEYVSGVIIGTSYVIQDSKNVIFYKVIKDIDDNLITTINRKEYRLPNNIGKVIEIGDFLATDYINYETKKVKYSTNVNSNGLNILKDTINTSYAGDGINISNPNGSSYFKSNAINWQSPQGQSFSNFIVNSDALIYTLYEHGLNFTITNTGNENHLSFSGKIICDSLEQTSLQSAKKNFEKFNGALEEIKNIDIYKYNLKNEKDNDKKHLGFVIGDDFNYSKVVTSNDNKGVDNYSFTSLCLQAIKEQQEKIELLEKQLNDIINIIKESE